MPLRQQPDTTRPRFSLTAGVLVVLAVGAVICRFGRAGSLSRDESVYLYAGQQLAKGVPPYVSIFDPKGPLSALVIGGIVKVADLLSVDDLSLVRLSFFVLTCAAVALQYWLGIEIFAATAPAALSAVVLGMSYRFARDAWSGPNPKTLTIALVLGLCLAMIHRRWLLAGVVAGLATLAWQPLIFEILVVVVAAAWIERERRARAVLLSVAGPALIGVATVVWFAVAGAFGKFLDATLRFPLGGVHHADATWSIRIRIIRDVLFHDYGPSGYLVAVGLVLFFAVGAAQVWRHRRGPHPPRAQAAVLALGPSCLLMVAYSNYDFQGAPDLFPLLPFAALGWGLGLALLGQALGPAPGGIRRVLPVLVLAVVTVPLLAYSWVSFGHDDDNGKLVAERQDAATLRKLAGPQHSVLAIGDPAPLALAHLTNPDPIIYMAGGEAAWKVKHTKGGMPGWMAQIEREAPRVVVVHGSHNAQVTELVAWFRSRGFSSSKLGAWRVLVPPAAG